MDPFRPSGLFPVDPDSPLTKDGHGRGSGQDAWCPVLRAPLLGMLTMFVLSGCYFPASFNADIELSRNGFYKLSFDGYVVDLGLYDQLAKGELKPDTPEAQERIQRTITDFQRDGATQEISYYGQGAFKVVWSRSGDMVTAKYVTFVRRNEKMLSITYSPEDLTLTVRGTTLGPQDRERLAGMGIGMQGNLRIRTDAPVVSNNATDSVTKDDVTTYEWQIKSLDDPAPQMVVKLR